MPMSKITVYTTEPCSFCVHAKALLRKRGLDFAEISLAKDPDGRAELARRTGMLSFPQVLVGDEVIGGFRELLQADEQGRLEELGDAAAV
jgi:glutaredoxin 3